jgi:WD40 repeat protein
MLYKAFISYSIDADDKSASVLRSALQDLVRPWYRLHSIQVFRDETGLSAGSALWPSIEHALIKSEYFLLLASPQSAQSSWVNREVKWWLDHRSTKNMLILLTDGKIIWDNTVNDYNWQQTTALPQILRNQFKDEPLYVDFRWLKEAKEKLSLRHPKFRNHILKVAEPLYGKPSEELEREDALQRKKNKLWAWSAGVLLLIAIIAALFWAHNARENARISFSQLLSNRATLIGEQQANLLPQSIVLATEAIKQTQTFAADQALYKGLSLLGPKPVEQRSYSGLVDLVLSPHGKYIVQIPYDGPAEVQETLSGKAIASLINLSPFNKPLPAIRQVSFSADEKRIATLSSLGISTFVWELPNGLEIFRTPVNRGAIITTVLSDDGNYLVTGHTNGMVYLWNISSGNEVLSFSHSDPPHTIKFSPSGRFLAVSSSQGTYYGTSSISMVRLWDIEKNLEIAQLQHVSAVTQCVFSPDGKYLATTSRIGQEQQKKDRIGVVKVWETETGQEIANMKHEEAVNTIAFTANSKYLLTGSSDGYLRIWDIVSGQEQLRINHKSSVELVDLVDLEGFTSFFVTAGSDNTIRFWGAYSPAEERLRLMESPNIVSFVHDIEGKYLVTISRDIKSDASTSPKHFKRDVRVWTTSSIMEKRLRLDHEHVVGGVQFSSPDGRYLATFDFQMPTSELIPKTETTNARFIYTDQGSGSASVWDVKNRKRLTHLKHPGTVMAIDYSANGKHLATACVDGIVRVFEVPGGKEAANLKHEGWVYQVKFTPDGQYVASSSGRPELLQGNKGNALVTIWDWRTGKKMGHLQSDTLIPSIAFSPDGKLLAGGEYDGTVHLLRTTDAREIKIFADNDSIWALAFSPDGSYLATASGGAISENSPLQKGMTTLWKVDDGNKIELSKSKHQSWAITVAFSPDGKYLASMDQNGEVGIWTTDDGKKIASIEHDEYVAQAKIHFSPDSSKYLATGFGNKAQIWEVTTGKEVARREHGRGYLWDVTFSPDGKYLATASTDTTSGLWLWRPEDLINEACARLPRNLTPTEWRQYVGEDVPYHATCDNLE